MAKQPNSRQLKLQKLLEENVGLDKPKTMGEMLLEAGYSESVADTPSKVTKGKSWQELMDQYLPDDKLAEVHQGLLNSTKIEHMVFPLYNKPDEDEEPEEQPETTLEPQPQGGALLRRHKVIEGAGLSNDDITEMLAEVNCTVRKIVQGLQARHVYFWSPDATARKNALELAFKIKGRITNKVALSGEVNTTPLAGLTTEEIREALAKRQNESS